MQTSTHRLGQGVEVRPFVQNHIWSKSFVGMFSKKKKRFLTWLQIFAVWFGFFFLC